MGPVEMLTKLLKAVVVMFIVWLSGMYGLSFAWILIGTTLGVLYIKQRRNRAHQYSKTKELANESKAVNDAFQELPCWVNFPDVERAEWLNKILYQFWPYFGKYVENALRESVEPMLRTKVPSSLSGIRFETIRLGDLPPRIGGIKVHIHNVRRSEVILDVDVIYAGDSKITVTAKGLKIGVEDIQIRGTIRVVLYPLLPEAPLLGGLTMYFINRPRVDFDLTNVLNVLETPGLSTVLRNLVDDAIAGFMVLPNKLAIPLSGSLQFRFLYSALTYHIYQYQIFEHEEESGNLSHMTFCNLLPCVYHLQPDLLCVDFLIFLPVFVFLNFTVNLLLHCEHQLSLLFSFFF